METKKCKLCAIVLEEPIRFSNGNINLCEDCFKIYSKKKEEREKEKERERKREEEEQERERKRREEKQKEQEEYKKKIDEANRVYAEAKEKKRQEDLKIRFLCEGCKKQTNAADGYITPEGRKFCSIACSNVHSRWSIYKKKPDTPKPKPKEQPPQTSSRQFPKEQPTATAAPIPQAPSKKEITLPMEGKIVSKFAQEVAKNIKDKNVIFFRTDSREIVEIGKIKVKKDGEEKYTGFLSVRPSRFITLCERYIIPGIERWNTYTKEDEFKEKSISPQLAKTLLASDILQQALPPINRIFTVPIPIMYEGTLTFPKEGYDDRFCSWLPHNAPKITKTDMDVKTAVKILYQIYKEFCFKSNQDYCNAIAGLITPFVKGLYPTFNTLSPVFFYLGNRPRSGKDYLAGITGIVLEGAAMEEPAVSSGEGNNNDELRKKILAAMISGRKRLHFSNNKGHLNNVIFEGVVTSERWSDRVLGRSEVLLFDNELNFSLSGNTGITYEGDFANRCIFVNLAYPEEDANARTFKNPDLHNKIKKNRELILSVIYALIRNWIEKGMPKGSVPFTSFPKWAEVVGGIMECAGYQNPCNPNKSLNVGGNIEEEHMKLLFELCFQNNPNHFMNKKDIKDIIICEKRQVGEAPFDFLDLENKNEDKVEFGYKISRFIGRELSGITMILERDDVRTARQRFMFTKDSNISKKEDIFKIDKNIKNLGRVGTVGTVVQLKNFQTSKTITGVASIPSIPTIPPNIPSYSKQAKLKGGNQNGN